VVRAAVGDDGFHAAFLHAGQYVGQEMCAIACLFVVEQMCVKQLAGIVGSLR
jgi:hypothetical protein